MVITTQFTADYKDKAHVLRESVDRHWNGQYFQLEFERNKTFRTDWPKNRDSYACMQHGEFTEYMKCDDEIIICVDADSVMNRPFTSTELNIIKARLKHCDILSVYGAYEPNTMLQVVRNIGYQKCDLTEFHGQWFSYPEFTASFMVARKSTFAAMAKKYDMYFDAMTEAFPHHAGTQWLINWVAYSYFKVGILPKSYQCGAWYTGCTEQDAANAVFNHTK